MYYIIVILYYDCYIIIVDLSRYLHAYIMKLVICTHPHTPLPIATTHIQDSISALKIFRDLEIDPNLMARESYNAP